MGGRERKRDEGSVSFWRQGKGKWRRGLFWFIALQCVLFLCGKCEGNFLAVVQFVSWKEKKKIYSPYYKKIY